MRSNRRTTAWMGALLALGLAACSGGTYPPGYYTGQPFVGDAVAGVGRPHPGRPFHLALAHAPASLVISISVVPSLPARAKITEV